MDESQEYNFELKKELSVYYISNIFPYIKN